uniref:Secreted protein n=1 Tax=Octopus bimaculoides TaxID=37653 RepID=A0A0L8G379_OCTBM
MPRMLMMLMMVVTIMMMMIFPTLTSPITLFNAKQNHKLFSCPPNEIYLYICDLVNWLQSRNLLVTRSFRYAQPLHSSHSESKREFYFFPFTSSFSFT